jgi:ubiquitin-conjugating enzyme E2 G1
MTQRGTAQRMLLRMFQKLQDEPSTYFSCGLVGDNAFKWRCTIIGPANSPFEGGMFPTELTFPETFPNDPPEMRFICPMWHPNIDKKTGRVCISILHKPGDDPNEYELAAERWLPVHTVETIVVSVISMLLDPNCESPLNVEAARELRTSPRDYARKVRRLAHDAIAYC